MKLSDHFSYEELTHSDLATRRGIDNTPPPEVLKQLKRTALGLEGVRLLLGAPIHITSGFRSQALERALKDKPDTWASTSHHTTGDAADFICPGFGPPVTIVSRLVNAELTFDQLIEEYADRPNGGWVHISFRQPMRGQVLRIDSKGTRAWS